MCPPRSRAHGHHQLSTYDAHKSATSDKLKAEHTLRVHQASAKAPHVSLEQVPLQRVAGAMPAASLAGTPETSCVHGIRSRQIHELEWTSHMQPGRPGVPIVVREVQHACAHSVPATMRTRTPCKAVEMPLIVCTFTIREFQRAGAPRAAPRRCAHFAPEHHADDQCLASSRSRVNATPFLVIQYRS